MEQSKILQYAKRHIETTANENNIQAVGLSNDTVYIEMVSGKNYELSQKEVEYQAEMFLMSELEDLRN